MHFGAGVTSQESCIVVQSHEVYSGIVVQEPRGVHVPGDPGGAWIHYGAQLPIHHQADPGNRKQVNSQSEHLFQLSGFPIG
jgi:hypothetical protein